MKLQCDWSISGQGTMDVDLCEIGDLTPEGIEEWILYGVGLEIHEQHNYSVTLRPSYSEQDLEEALLKARQEMEE